MVIYALTEQQKKEIEASLKEIPYKYSNNLIKFFEKLLPVPVEEIKEENQ